MPVELPKGLPFSVDTWSASSMKKKYHFLTHAHRDHSVGINANSKFPIYCTSLTQRLLRRHFPQLDESLFVDLEVGESLVLRDVDEDFCVTAYDANHCPGAVMFLFEGSFGCVLHTGDCRLTPDCLSNLPDKYVGKKGRHPKCRLDFVFLDCTFGKCYLAMPNKNQATKQVINCIWKHPEASVVYLVCDLLGQEEILRTVSQTFGSKIFIDEVSNPDCFHALKLTVPDILSQDPSCRFHIFAAFPNLQERAEAKFSEAKGSFQPAPLIIRPSTQWYAHGGEFSNVNTHIKPRVDEALRDNTGIWHVCYSIHSSREELEWALQLLSPKHVISTTPGCWAMDLDYFKKNQLRCKKTSDDALLKLLQIPYENYSNELTSNAVEHLVQCSIDTYVDSSSINSSPEKMILSISPTSKRPITLFGKARTGVVEDFKKDPKKAKFSDNDKSKATSQSTPSDVQTKEPSEKNVIVTESSLESSPDISVLMEPSIKTAETQVSSYIGSSSNCFSESFRRMYRSRNLPIPRLLPSLVDLMNASNKKLKK